MHIYIGKTAAEWYKGMLLSKRQMWALKMKSKNLKEANQLLEFLFLGKGLQGLIKCT